MNSHVYYHIHIHPKYILLIIYRKLYRYTNRKINCLIKVTDKLLKICETTKMHVQN